MQEQLKSIDKLNINKQESEDLKKQFETNHKISEEILNFDFNTKDDSPIIKKEKLQQISDKCKKLTEDLKNLQKNLKDLM